MFVIFLRRNIVACCPTLPDRNVLYCQHNCFLLWCAHLSQDVSVKWRCVYHAMRVLFSQHVLNLFFIIGRTLRKFTQLKRKRRFDNFIMLVWVQGSPLHIAAGSHPVQEALGSQDSLYRGQIQNLLQCCQKPYQHIPLVITIQKKYSLTYLRRTVS